MEQLKWDEIVCRLSVISIGLEIHNSILIRLYNIESPWRFICVQISDVRYNVYEDDSMFSYTHLLEEETIQYA
jgi:hypothetical protein